MKRTIPSLAVAALLAGTVAVSMASAQGVTFVGEQKAGELAAVRLAGTRVFNAKGDVIGTISDVMLGPDGRAQTIVVGVGGWMGLGAKEVGVPYAAVKVGPVVEGSRVLLLDVTKDDLQKAPQFKATDPSRADRAKKKASDWIKIARDKAVELGKQASDAVKDMRDKMATPPAGGAGGSTPPSPSK